MDDHLLDRRPVRPDDLVFVGEVYRAGFKAHVDAIWGWDEARQREHVESLVRDDAVEIIEEAGVPIGYLSVVHEIDYDFLEMIAIAPEAQRRGVGSHLVGEAMSDAASRGVPVRLSVLQGNPAERLYVRLGFVVVSVEAPRTRMEWRPLLPRGAGRDEQL